MRRLAFRIVGLYLLAALATRMVEAAGFGQRCGCQPACWCKRPGWSLFRWVTPPAMHRLIEPADKRAMAEDASH